MPESLLRKLKSVEPLYVQDPRFMTFAGSYAAALRTDNRSAMVSVSATDQKLHRYRFYDYLTTIGADTKYHYLILRVNGMTSPREFDYGCNYIVIPNNQVMDAAIDRYLAGK